MVQGPLDGHCELPRARDVLLAASAAVRVASATFYSRVRADDDMRAHSVNLLRALSLIASATVYGYYERVYGVSPVCEIFFTSERCSQEFDFIPTISPLMNFFDDRGAYGVAGASQGAGIWMCQFLYGRQKY